MKFIGFTLALILGCSCTNDVSVSINLEDQENSANINVISIQDGAVMRKRYVPNPGVAVTHVHDGDYFIWRAYPAHTICKSALMTYIDEDTRVLYLEIESYCYELSMYYKKDFMWCPIGAEEYNRLCPISDEPER